MRPYLDLNKKCDKFVKKSSRLRQDVANAQHLSFRERDRVVGYSVLQFHNLWGSYCRSIALSAYYGAKDCTGVKTNISVPSGLSSGCINIEEYIYEMTLHCKPFLRRRYNRPPIQSRDEPAWHNIDTLYNGLNFFSYSNLHAVDSARSFYSGVLRHFTDARNFYAHKKKGTNFKLLKTIRQEYPVSFSYDEHATDILYKRPRGYASPLILYWMDVIRSGAYLMT